MKCLSYDDVALVPKCGIVKSRSECDVSVNFLGHDFKSPVIPANMRASINIEKAFELIKNGYFYILHRFYPYEEIKKFINECHLSLKLCSISIGVQQQDYELIQWIVDNLYNVDFITIDVAHGHSLSVKAMLKYIEHKFPKHLKPSIIVGNVASSAACEDLIKWGADAIKVGIGQGHTCTTRLQTGFGLPMFSCVLDCVRYGYLSGFFGAAKRVPIIADGGIYHYGDVAKAFVAGADMVMVGSMFARCIDSPAKNVDITGHEYNITVSKTPTHKRWFGSASEHNKGKKEHVEGIERIEPCNGLTYDEMFLEWKQALRSAVSYAGGNELKDLKHVEWRVVK